MKTSRLITLVMANLLTGTSLLLPTLANSETVRVPIGQDTQAWTGKAPNRGQTKAQVKAEFGDPQSEQGPSGQPPIYFWEYADFTVYFEAEHVIHTVIKHRK
ncbi:hypothetical protein [Agarilytica rhodophyticola]|uniref:hypothetical protein n=1 Tax=Agarilytica rhodophyticola TaxID=1737490 RepID=UPI001FE60531|nr:hypothetical protein [Agarilytica rhodophyticola]